MGKITTVVFDIGNVLIRYDGRDFLKRLFDEETAKIVGEAIFGGKWWNELDRGVIPQDEIVEEFIREKCLRNLDKEIPHGIAVVVDKMHTRSGRNGDNVVDIEATIICERESHKGIIIGKNGSMLKRIGSDARHEIEDMLQEKVNLRLWVKVRPGWRDKKNYLSEYGYKKKV